MTSTQIQVKDLTFFYYNSAKPALSDVNLELRKGEITCITGVSGGGKTTLGLALSGHIPHTIAGELTGEIYFQGVPSSNLSITEISQFVGLVQQDPENQLVTPTILEEVAFGPENLSLPKHEILNRVQASLKTMDLISLASRSTNELSGGEKQRVAIASILAMCPQVLVLDEPMSYLDYQSSQKLISALRVLNLQEKLTIILIEQQPYLFKEFIDRLIVIEKGRIIGETVRPNIDFTQLEIPKKALRAIQELRSNYELTQSLDIKNLSIKLKNRSVLKNISAELKRGYIYAIVGPNGAGKTTFLQALLNLIPSKGIILYNKKSISKIPTFQLAKDFGLVFQNPNHQIFEKSVLDEVIFASKNFHQDLNEVDFKAKELLRGASLEPYLKVPPYGLSYGEKRRLNLCSVLIYEPDIIMLDEPFIGQDRANVEYLLHLLKERKLMGYTSIIVSHRKELFNLVDYLFVLDKGELINKGPPREIIPFLNNKGFTDFTLDLLQNEK